MKERICTNCKCNNPKKYVKGLCNACYCEVKRRDKGISKKVKRSAKDIKDYKAKWYQDNKIEMQEKNKIWNDNNKEKVTSYKSRWRKNNPNKIKEYLELNVDKVKQYKASYFKKNKETLSNKHKEWVKNNKEKDLEYKNKNRNKYKSEYNIKISEWKKINKGKVKEYSAYRRTMQKNATPKWVNRKHLEEIYQNCPEGYEVDHIIPIVNDMICGLHVPWNLQYLTKSENKKKSNKFYLNSETNK